MKKKVDESEFIELYFDDKSSVYMWKFLPTTEGIEIEQLKEIISFKTSVMKNYQPKFVIANDIENNATFAVEVQTWIAETVVGAMKKCNVEKFAVLRPQEFIVGLSTEQAVDEVNALAEGIEVAMFSELEEAEQWLLSEN